MVVTHLNCDPGLGAEFDNAEVVVTDYEDGCYEGSGEALVLRNGVVEHYDLGHCSCYGPFENACSRYPLHQYHEVRQTATCPWSDKIDKAFAEAMTFGK